MATSPYSPGPIAVAPERVSLAGWMLAAAVAVFLLVAVDLLLHGPLTGSGDAAISLWFASHREPGLMRAWWIVTDLHSTAGICGMSVVLAVALIAARRAAWVIAMLVIVQGGLLLNFGVKHLFGRVRPAWDAPLVHLDSSSFPSGHAAGATVFWFFVVLACGAVAPPGPLRRTVTVVAIVAVVATCVSRVALGAHFPSDVIGGAAEGVAWAALWQLVFGLGEEDAPRRA